MGAQPLSPYQQLIEKIDSLSVRSETLSGLIDRKLKAKTDVSIKKTVNQGNKQLFSFEGNLNPIQFLFVLNFFFEKNNIFYEIYKA